MTGCGIISEYNPFHNGHKYQIDLLKSKYPSAVTVSLMSPNFVQRGECAIFDKYQRAAAAVSAGVDVSLSIPLVFSVLSAEGYAEAGVRLAHSLGLDAISFGVECDDSNILLSVAEFMISDEYKISVERICKEQPSLSLIRAGEQAVEKAFGKEYASVLSSPNNILALEYIKAIKRLNLGLDIIPIKREGAGYKSLDVSPLPSATLVRKRIYDREELEGLVPDSCLELYKKYIFEKDYCEKDTLFSHIHFALLQKDRDSLSKCVGSVELADRIKKALHESEDLESAISKAVTTRFTRSRVTRALISSLLNISYNFFMHTPPAYTQLLAFNERGRRFLSSRRKEDFPIITKNADATQYRASDLFSSQWDAECIADSLWALSCSSKRQANHFMKQSPFFLKQN